MISGWNICFLIKFIAFVTVKVFIYLSWFCFISSVCQENVIFWKPIRIFIYCLWVNCNCCKLKAKLKFLQFLYTWAWNNRPEWKIVLHLSPTHKHTSLGLECMCMGHYFGLSTESTYILIVSDPCVSIVVDIHTL